MAAREEVLVMRDLVDERLRAPDGRSVARVAGLEAEWRADGSLMLTAMTVGPQEELCRIWRGFGRIARWLLRGRWEHRVPMEEIAAIELDIILRADPARYGVGTADAWVLDHILRFIPGNGRP